MVGNPRWRRLRVGLIVCAACTLAGGGAAGAGWWRERGAAQAFEGAQVRLAAARERYLALAEERRQWRRFGPLFEELHARGRIGEERPERWIEGVRAAAARLPDGKHRLGVPRTAPGAGPIAVRAADMSVDLELRHEGELPGFLAGLERNAAGLFTVSGCRLACMEQDCSSRAHGAAGGMAAIPGSGLARQPRQRLPTAPETAARTREGARGAERTGGAPPRVPALDSSPASISASCRLRWQTVLLAGVEPGWSPAGIAAAAGSGAGSETGEHGGGSRGAGAEADAEAGLAEPPPAVFGRLFTTPVERARLDSAGAVRETPAPAPALAPATAPALRPSAPPRHRPRWVHVNGVIARSGRPIFAWIDGERAAYRSPPAGAGRPAGGAAPGVRFDAGGRPITVRAGQRFDPATGTVADPIRRQRNARSERDEFLRESSRPPLTPPSAPGLD